jgi:predicted site-specific integrase-resolvase
MRDDAYLDASQSVPSPTKPEAVMLVKHLNQTDLARRWKISPRTLERWRWVGEGPAYLKVGGRVLYRLEDVEAHEQARLRQSTANVARVAGMAR